MAEIEIHKALGWDGKVPRPFEVAVAQAEASSADEEGGSSATAAEIAVATDLPVKEVRQIRALLIAAGFISIIHSGGHADFVTRRLHSPTVAPAERILPGPPTDR